MAFIRPTARRVVLALLLVLPASLNFAHAQTERACTVRVTLLQVNGAHQFTPADRGARGRRIRRLDKPAEAQPCKMAAAATGGR